MPVDSRQLYNFLSHLRTESETEFDFYGSEYVAQMLDNALFLQTNGKWNTETTVIFVNDKGATQMELTEFQKIYLRNCGFILTGSHRPIRLSTHESFINSNDPADFMLEFM
jgi:hypothetical protein